MSARVTRPDARSGYEATSTLLDWLDEHWEGTVDVQEAWRRGEEGSNPEPAEWLLTGSHDGSPFAISILNDPGARFRALITGRPVLPEVRRIDVYCPGARPGACTPEWSQRIRDLGFEVELRPGGVHAVRRDLDDTALAPEVIARVVESAFEMMLEQPQDATVSPALPTTISDYARDASVRDARLERQNLRRFMVTLRKPTWRSGIECLLSGWIFIILFELGTGVVCVYEAVLDPRRQKIDVALFFFILLTLTVPPIAWWMARGRRAGSRVDSLARRLGAAMQRSRRQPSALLDWLDEHWEGAVDVQERWRRSCEGGHHAFGYWFFVGEHRRCSFAAQVVNDPTPPRRVQFATRDDDIAPLLGVPVVGYRPTVCRIDLYMPAAWDPSRTVDAVLVSRATALGFELEALPGGVHLVRRDLRGAALAPETIRAALDCAVDVAYALPGASQ
jgi:hypothetical protein